MGNNLHRAARFWIYSKIYNTQKTYTEKKKNPTTPIFLLTEHGHVLSAIEVPVAPIGPVAMESGVFLMVICWLSTKCINHPDKTSVRNNDMDVESTLNDNSLCMESQH